MEGSVAVVNSDSLSWRVMGDLQVSPHKVLAGKLQAKKSFLHQEAGCERALEFE